MAGRVPQHVVEQIARNVDFARIVGRYCEVTSRGGRFWALCPFHQEKTPSFSIDPEEGLYYCFGCKEGGNIFTFLQKMEGLSFGEALRTLAGEAGVDLARYRAGDGPAPGKLTRLREVNELATAFYQKCLAKSSGGQKARDYLAERGFSAESVERWRLGYAPDGWEHFLNCAAGRDYPAEVVEAAGLALARKNAPGHYDRFRNRLMFPITDVTGRTIAFGARALEPDQEPKYLNSPETPLFNKSECFFGLARAAATIRSGRQAVVLEGYTDVIMAHQEGVQEAVAVLGTALTEEHGRRLSRLCERVVLVFDADEAGRKSAARSIEVLLDEELEIRVARLPAGQDPCEFILERGGDAFRRVVESSDGFFEFRLELARVEHDQSTIEGRTAAFRDVAEFAAKVADPARRDMIVRWIADELKVDPRSVWSFVQSRAPRSTPGGEGPEGRKLSAHDLVPGELLGLMLARPDLAADAAQRVPLEVLKDCAETEVLRRFLQQEQKGVSFVSSLQDERLAAAASAALAQEKARRQRVKDPERNARERLEGYLAYLNREAQRAAPDTPPEELDDRALMERAERLRQEDKQSANNR